MLALAAGPVTHPRVGLGLQRVQVSDQCRRQVLPRATQGGLGVLDDLTVQATMVPAQGSSDSNVAADLLFLGGAEGI
jgi:hypothetical protein